MAKTTDDVRRAYPTGRLLRAMRGRNWYPILALAEFIDNSFGERRGRAMAVAIEWDPQTRTLTILDNGRGMKNVAALFTLGEGVESGEGDIGTYGVGGSEAGPWLADQEDVWTLRRGRVAHMSANWARCELREEFPVITDQWVTATPARCPTELLTVEHGTFIRLKIRPKIQIHPDRFQERLGRVFGVGLRSGRRITWTTRSKDGPVETEIHEWAPPTPLENVIESTVTVSNGWTAFVRAGRVDGLSIENSKLYVNYQYRQIKATTQGFGRPIQGAMGFVDLSKEWLDALTTTKDNIREDYRDLEQELMSEVEQLLQPLIDELREAKRSKIFNNIKISLKHRFETGFEAIVQGSRSGRGRGGEQPKPPGPDPRPPRPHKSTAVAEIDIQQTSDDEIKGLLCRVEIDAKAAVAWINKDHEVIQMALEAEPVQQRLLEQILISALATEIVRSPDGLVKFGLFNRRDAEALLEKHDGDVFEVFLELQRILTDNVVDENTAA